MRITSTPLRNPNAWPHDDTLSRFTELAMAGRKEFRRTTQTPHATFAKLKRSAASSQDLFELLTAMPRAAVKAEPTIVKIQNKILRYPRSARPPKSGKSTTYKHKQKKTRQFRS
jgi:hypothetical protein